MVGSIEILIFVYFCFKISVVFVKPEPKREKHHMTLPESWNHHTSWRKMMVMESQTQTLVALVWGGSKMCLRKKDGSLFHIV